jgi:hypothetical protein
VVVANQRLSSNAPAGLTNLFTVANVGVRARSSFSYRVVLTAAFRVAQVRSTWIAVVATKGLARSANARLTCLGAVANIAIGAGSTVGHGSVPAAAGIIAAI